MPLSMTKVAYDAKSLDEITSWFSGDEAEKCLTTRYLPKRHAEMIGGSRYPLHQHAPLGRTPILPFHHRQDGRGRSELENRLIRVPPRAKRAHQGWRYLEDGDAPEDLPEGTAAGDVLPGRLIRKLAQLGLA